MRARLAVLAVVAVAGLIAVLGLTAIPASGAGHEAEVRISAQRLDDGRMEFALQQREADGGWSERLLPRGRFFPAVVGRWLSSAPLTVRSAGAGDDAEGTEVRITAQRLADGRTEIALQQREADGEWGERLLPWARFVPATARVGRWLSSTALMVSLPEPELSLDTDDDGGSVASDRAALVALYNATGGASWFTGTNWLSERPFGEWHGVTTNSDGRVTELWLDRNQLTGPIPAELGDLTNLQTLVLDNNELTGPIPAELGDRTNLVELWLSHNALTGAIPAELGDLTNLVSLNFSSNQLTGPIPAELGDLTNLQTLVLDNNQLTGPIPAELGDLINLQTLRLSGNQLTGCVPTGLRDVASNDLWQLDLPDCGEESLDTAADVESVASDRAALVALYNATGGATWLTSTNWLSDRPLDAWQGVITNSDGRVAELWIWGNNLRGPIPVELGDLTSCKRWTSGPTGCGADPGLAGRPHRSANAVPRVQPVDGADPDRAGRPHESASAGSPQQRADGGDPDRAGRAHQAANAGLSNNELTGPIPAWLATSPACDRWTLRATS